MSWQHSQASDVTNQKESIFYPASINLEFIQQYIRFRLKGFNRIGGIDIAKFKLLPGLSTSSVKALGFWEYNSQENLLSSDSRSISVGRLVTAVTPAFLNYDFRVGGTIGNILNYCALGTIAYYPNYDTLVNYLYKTNKGYTISSLSCLDCFLGVELSTNFKYANGSFWVGCRYSPLGEISIITFDSPCPVVMQAWQLAVGMSVSIGPFKSGGQNILRVL